MAVGPATPGGHPLEGHFLPQTMTGRAWAPTLPTSSQLRPRPVASFHRSLPGLGGGEGKSPDVKPSPLSIDQFSLSLFSLKASPAYLVRTNESDKHWEEHRRRCGLGALTEVAHHGIVGLLGSEGSRGQPGREGDTGIPTRGRRPTAAPSPCRLEKSRAPTLPRVCSQRQLPAPPIPAFPHIKPASRA